MIDMLVGGELPAGSFVAAFPNVTQPAISQHLKVLRDAGLVEVRADKQRRLYSLKPEALAPLRDWLDPHAPAPEIAVIEVVESTQAKKQKPKAKPIAEPELTLDLFG